MSPSHPRCPQGWQGKFLQPSHRAGCRHVFERGGCGHLGAPVQGCSAHKSLYEQPERELPRCPPGHGTEPVCSLRAPNGHCPRSTCCSHETGLGAEKPPAFSQLRLGKKRAGDAPIQEGKEPKITQSNIISSDRPRNTARSTPGLQIERLLDLQHPLETPGKILRFHKSAHPLFATASQSKDSVAHTQRVWESGT